MPSVRAAPVSAPECQRRAMTLRLQDGVETLRAEDVGAGGLVRDDLPRDPLTERPPLILGEHHDQCRQPRLGGGLDGLPAGHLDREVQSFGIVYVFPPRARVSTTIELQV